MTFSVNKLNKFLHKSTPLQWLAYKKILRYIKGTLSHGLFFKVALLIKLECYADVNWASNIQGRRSTIEYCLYLGFNIIQWFLKKIKSRSLVLYKN